MKSILSETEINEMKARQRGYELTDARQRARKAGTKTETSSQKSKRIVAEVKAAESASKRRTKSATPSVKAAPAVEIAPVAAETTLYAIWTHEKSYLMRVVCFVGERALVKGLRAGGEELEGCQLLLFKVGTKSFRLFSSLDDAHHYAKTEQIHLEGGQQAKPAGVGFSLEDLPA